MVRGLTLLFVLALALVAQELLERVERMLPPETYRSHARLVALLFEDESAFREGEGYDMVKVAETLEKNGLLILRPAAEGGSQITFECNGSSPILLVKVASDALRGIGYPSLLTLKARRDDEGFHWSVRPFSDSVANPALLGVRLKKFGVAVREIERLERGKWRYRLDLSRALLPALPIGPSETKKIVRPVRPVWIDVSRIRDLTIRELPGSHWYPDVVVYDKMLKILSLRQRDARTRYLHLRLPADAAYVKIGDRFTLENLRSGLRLSARGSR